MSLRVISMVLGSFSSYLCSGNLLSYPCWQVLQTLTLGSRSLDSTRRSGATSLIESCRRSSTPGPGPRIPFSLWAGRAFSGIYSCGQQFSCGVIDIVESMSRRVILAAVCTPPSVSFFRNFYDVTLSDFRLILYVDV